MINRLPSAPIEYKTPLELWNKGELPDLRYIRVFGSKFGPHVPIELQKSKVEPRCIDSFLVGFSKVGYHVVHPGSPQAPFEANGVYFDEMKVYGSIALDERTEPSNADVVQFELTRAIELDHDYFLSMKAEFCADEMHLSDKVPHTYSDIEKSAFRYK